MRIVLFAVTAALIAGCGQKGPLKLPPDKPAPTKPAAAPADGAQPPAAEPGK